MKLNNLKIFKNEELIRLVNFKNGLNLITNSLDKDRTGNGVGKSTLSRVLDFLFGANIDIIYSETEYKQANIEIYNFFEKNNIIAELEFLDKNGNICIISKTLSNNEDNIRYYTNNNLTDKISYYYFIKNNLFNLTSKTPTLREVLPKFIRNNSYRMQSTTKFLDKYTDDNKYLEIYLYFFGFSDLNIIEENRSISNDVTKKNNRKKIINNLVNEKKPKTELKILARQIKPLEKDFLELNFGENEISPLSTLSKIEKNIEKLIFNLLDIERNISNIEGTVNEISNSNKTFLNNELLEIYEYANINISNTLKTLDEATAFHEILVSRKIEFLKIKLPSLIKQRDSVFIKIQDSEAQKSIILSKLNSQENINKAQILLKKIGDIRSQMGELEGLLKNQIEANNAFNEVKDRHLKILKKISENLKSINDFCDDLVFNFTSIIKKLYNLKSDPNFEINFSFVKNKLKLNTVNTLANPEGGMKKAEVIAFDLAYIQTVVSKKMIRPTFIIHDAIEDIDNQQIEKLFDFSNSLLDGQQIVSLLSDKLDDSLREKFKSSIILELNQDNKFFKI
jgi:uncharacterized protein YydD (DUF2326 family)